MVLLVDLLGLEVLELPQGPQSIAGTAISAIFASTVNVLNLVVIMLGSPMLLPCAYLLSVPLTDVLDALLHGVVASGVEVTGHVLLVLSVVLILDLAPKLTSRSGSRRIQHKAQDV